MSGLRQPSPVGPAHSPWLQQPHPARQPLAPLLLAPTCLCCGKWCFPKMAIMGLPLEWRRELSLLYSHSVRHATWACGWGGCEEDAAKNAGGWSTCAYCGANGACRGSVATRPGERGLRTHLNLVDAAQLVQHVEAVLDGDDVQEGDLRAGQRMGSGDRDAARHLEAWGTLHGGT